MLDDAAPRDAGSDNGNAGGGRQLGGLSVGEGRMRGLLPEGGGGLGTGKAGILFGLVDEKGLCRKWRGVGHGV